MLQTRIRLLKSPEEFRRCERIQQSVWGTLGASAELLSVTQKQGGVVLGAFSGPRLVGFLYAFLAQRHGRLIHWSHMMAVEPPWRDRGLGWQMKLAHRQIALRRGLEAIGWTYDPLQSRNAALNLTRLGGRVEEYVRDCYGRFPSAIEKGLASDRLVVNWPIASASVARRLRRRHAPAVDLSLPRANETALNSRQLLENRRLRLGLTAPRLLFEIPSHTDRMRAEALPLARRWRLEARRVFEHYFARGYDVLDFAPPASATGGRCFYILGRPGA